MKRSPMLLPIVAMAAFAGPVRGAPGEAVIACGPPIDMPLTLTMTQYFFLADGSAASATVTRSLRFRREAEGLLVEAHIADLATDDANPGALERLRFGYGAPGGVPIVVRLDAAMAVDRIDSLDRLWQDFHNRQIGLASAMGERGRPNDRARALGKMLDAMSVADRTAVLSAFLKPVLRHCGTPVPLDARIQPDGTLETEIRVDAGDARDVSQYRIDGRTGLMRALDRTVTSAAAPLRPMREHWTLEPAP